MTRAALLRFPRGERQVARLVLQPFALWEVAEVSYAARWAGVTPKCVREWCEAHALGRKVAGRWHVSRLAFAMWIEGDRATLARYHAGDRSPVVLAYLDRMSVGRAVVNYGKI